MFSKEIIESFKSFLRLILLAIIPVLISSLSSNHIDWRSTLVAVVLSTLYAVQDWLHQKDVKSPLDMQGGILDSTVAK